MNMNMNKELRVRGRNVRGCDVECNGPVRRPRESKEGKGRNRRVRGQKYVAKSRDPTS